MSLVSLFCKVDDFCLSFEPAWEAMLIEREGHSRGYRRLSLGEVMTITIFISPAPLPEFQALLLR